MYIQRIKTAGALRRLFCDSIVVFLSQCPERARRCVVDDALHNQQQKSNTKSVSDGEFGMQVDSKVEIAPGDHIEAFDIVVV